MYHYILGILHTKTWCKVRFHFEEISLPKHFKEEIYAQMDCSGSDRIQVSLNEFYYLQMEPKVVRFLNGRGLSSEN